MPLKVRLCGKLIPMVYDGLRRLAGAYMRRERSDRTLQSAPLVHEAYLKLVEQCSVDWLTGKKAGPPCRGGPCWFGL